jgi:hypothetical protein
VKSQRTPGLLRSPGVAIGATIAVLAATLAGFTWIAIQSYGLIHSDEAPLTSSALEPVKTLGPEETVFDWSRQACENRDVPDAPARAFRDAAGAVHLIASHYVTRQMTGPSLDRVEHRCAIAMTSGYSPRPRLFEDKEWITAPYTLDGKTVYALVHDEFQGYVHPGRCASTFYLHCWYNAVTLALSTDGGATFRHARRPPGHLVATVPYRYTNDAGSYGVFQPSNIVAKDGYFYSLVSTQRYGVQRTGTCVIRTNRLADPSSWRAWDGEDYAVEFVDPYAARVDAARHVCEPVDYDAIGKMTHSLTYNTYFDKYLLVAPNGQFDFKKRRVVWGFYYSLSDDLVHWSKRTLIKETELTWTYRCGDPDPVSYPSVLDPGSDSRNFETTGRRPYIYFTRVHYRACEPTLDRDLVRVPVEFSK